MNIFRNLIKYRYLIRVLVTRDIKIKYRRSVFGVLWSILNPLLMMIITSMVFSTLFRFDLPNYILYLLVGQVVFTFFSESTNFAMWSILGNASLLKKVYVPKYLFPLSRVLSSCVNLIFTIPAVVVMMVYTGASISYSLMSMLFPILSLLIFCIGVGLALSALVVYFRDIAHFYGVLLTGLNYATPIFYPEAIVPEEYKVLLFFNPLYYYLKMFRQVIWQGNIPDMQLMLLCSFMSLFALLIGGVVFKRAQNQFILYM